VPIWLMDNQHRVLWIAGSIVGGCIGGGVTVWAVLHSIKPAGGSDDFAYWIAFPFVVGISFVIGFILGSLSCLVMVPAAILKSKDWVVGACLISGPLIFFFCWGQFNSPYSDHKSILLPLLWSAILSVYSIYGIMRAMR
jgi:hypothetical protein